DAPIMKPDGKGGMIMAGFETFAPVPVAECFVGAFGTQVFVGATSQDEQRVIPIGMLLTGAMNGMPDAFGGAGQASIFGNNGAGNSINLEISGPDLVRVRNAAGFAIGTLMRDEKNYGPRSVRPDPANFNLAQPE